MGGKINKQGRSFHLTCTVCEVLERQRDKGLSMSAVVEAALRKHFIDQGLLIIKPKPGQRVTPP